MLISIATAWTAASAAFSVSAQTPSSGDLLIRNVMVVSPERARPLRHADVLIREGRIAAVGTDLHIARVARRIDGTGKFLVPGLIDSHVHIAHSAALDESAIRRHPELWAAYRAQVPRAYLAFGFTTVVDLDMNPEDTAWFEAAPQHPFLLHCGPGIKVASGYGAFSFDPVSPRAPNVVYEPAEASSWPKGLDTAKYSPNLAVARAVRAGARCVKAFVEPGFGLFHWPYLHVATVAHIHEAARESGLPLAVHATGIDAWRIALVAHAEILAHGLWVWPGALTDTRPPVEAQRILAEVARAGVYVQPTLQTVAGERAFADTTLLHDPRLPMSLPAGVIAYLRSAEGDSARKELLQAYRSAAPPPGFEFLLSRAIERTRASFRLMLRDGVRLIFGSDTPAGDGFGNPPGLNGRLEMGDWVRAGATPAQILRAATLENARAFGLEDTLGTIEVGKRADLLLLRRNPLASVAAYDAIEGIILGGRLIPENSLEPASTPRVAPRPRRPRPRVPPATSPARARRSR